MEARWRTESEQGPGYYATSYSTWVTYGTSLVTNIIENLQLNIKDVHIRYEDTATLPNSLFFFYKFKLIKIKKLLFNCLLF